MLSKRQIPILALLNLIVAHLGHALPNLDIIGKTFKLSSQYQFERQDGAHAVEIEELHSGPQRRSILHYTRQETDSYRSTFLSSDKQVIKINPKPRKCQSVGHDYLMEFFHGIPESYFNSEHLYLLGAGKLLALVVANADKFVQRHSPDEFDVFEGVFQNEGRKFAIYLYYSKNCHKNSQRVIPQMVQLSAQSEEHPWLISFNITQFQLLDDGFQSSLSAAAKLNQFEDPAADWVTYDLFAFEQAIGCLVVEDSLPESISKRLAEKDLGRFSFETELRGTRTNEALGSGMQKASVTFESALSMLRVHQVEGAHDSNSIYDFRYNRRYHTIKRRPLQDTQEDFVDSQIGQQAETSSCVISLVKDSHSLESKSSPFSLGRILFGSEKLNYVGRARVRGIETSVYQWPGSDWPVWLQPPMVYEDQGRVEITLDRNPYSLDHSMWRDNLKTMKESGVSMTGVFFFSKAGPAEDEILDARLLLVELILEHESEGQLARFSLPVYDFAWNLPNVGPNGGRYEDSISLEDNCLAGLDSNDYGTIQLEFEVTATEQRQLLWLRDRAKRNLALLEAMQSRFFLEPISMIQRIDSRLIPKSDTTAVIPVAIRAATRSKKLARVFFLCKLNPSLEYFDSFPTINLDACHMTVAHRRQRSVFAYDGQLCYVLRQELNHQKSLEVAITRACDESKRTGHAEMYQMVYEANAPNMFDHSDNPLIAIEHNKDFTDEIFLYDPSKERPIPLKVKRTGLITNLADSRIEYQLGEQHLGDVNKFTGFGLVSSDTQNKLVELNEQVMSFEACQTACMADFECRSFSVCTSRGQLRCIMSTISFNTPAIVLQMMQLNEMRSKLNEKFTLNVDQTEQRPNSTRDGESPQMDSVQVIKTPSCELHNKLYSDYFQLSSSRVMYTSGKRLFRPVSGKEQCAELCFRKTIEFFRTLAQGVTSSDELVKGRQQLMKSGICFTIDYVSKQEFERDGQESERHDLTTEFKEILSKLEKMNHSEEVNGFCVINNYNKVEEIGDNEIVVSHDVLKKIWFNTYNFDFLRFFEQKAGISLTESKMSSDERKKLEKEMSDALERGQAVKYPIENLGWIESGVDHPRYCAMRCFQSTWTTLLGCRSFEYFEIDSPVMAKEKVCTFNTVTVKSSVEANKTGLVKYGPNEQTRIRTGSSDTVQVWHFEPRAGLFSESLDRLYTFTTKRDNSKSHISRTGPQLRAPTLASVIVVLLISGIVFGFVLGAKYLKESLSEEVDLLFDGGSQKQEGSRMEFVDMNRSEAV